MSDTPTIDAVYDFTAALNEIGIPVLIGGSLASITWGEPRFTQDVDVVAHMEEHHAEELVARLSGSWYVDAESIREAIRQSRSFNVIRFDGMMKIDVFVPRREGHHAEKWERARAVRLTADAPHEVLVTGPEDIILQKLSWFRSGNEVSEQQWRDVTALLRIRKGLLDEPYLDEWARTLGISDLLQRARHESEA